MPTPPDLESQAAAGDAEGQYALGVQLMGRADTFEKFERAAALMEQSADRDHGEATAMLATLEAVGAGRPRDWNRAFDYLALAAERGSDHARGQLRLLARMSAASDPADADQDWRLARARIDIGALLQAPAPAPLAERPRLRVFHGFARADECRWLMARLQPRLHPAVVWDEVTGEGVVDDYRSNSAAEVPVQDMDVVIALLRARISEATRLPEFIFEIPQLMHYKVGEEFKPHHDYLDPAKPGFAVDYARRGQRMGTFLLFLNEDFEGGETEFPQAGISFRGKTGDAIFFANVTRDGQPDPMTLHAGRPPTRGEKWILSQWIRERPPAEAMAAPSTG